MSNGMSDILMIDEAEDSAILNEEICIIMQAISESTEMLLKAINFLSGEIGNLKKERKADQAVIFKLLRDVKNLSKANTVKTTPIQPIKEKKWRVKKHISKTFNKIKKENKFIRRKGRRDVGMDGRSAVRWRKKNPTVLSMEVDVETHFPQQNWGPHEAPDTLINDSRGVVRKRESNSPELVEKRVKSNTGDSIKVYPNPLKFWKKKNAIKVIKEVKPEKTLSEDAMEYRERCFDNPYWIEKVGEVVPPYKVTIIDQPYSDIIMEMDMEIGKELLAQLAVFSTWDKTVQAILKTFENEDYDGGPKNIYDKIHNWRCAVCFLVGAEVIPAEWDNTEQGLRIAMEHFTWSFSNTTSESFEEELVLENRDNRNQTVKKKKRKGKRKGKKKSWGK